MDLTIAEAAQLLGKSERQVRYMIKTERLTARKAGGQWMIPRDALPFSEGQSRAVEHKLHRVREIVEESLGPSLDVAEKEAMDRRRRFGIARQPAFRLALPAHARAVTLLGQEHPCSLAIRQALFLLTEGWHEYQPQHKARPLREARVRFCQALTELLLIEDPGPEVVELTESIELQVLPALGGMLRHSERRDRR